MQRKFMVNFAISCALMMAAHAQTSGPSTGSALPPRHGGQQASSAPAGSQTAANPSAVGLDQPVITLKGGCQPIGDLQPAKDCVRSVTREQFEKLAHALQPEMPADAKRAFALNYGRLLVFFDAAQALHLEDDPGMQQVLKFVTQQVMAESVKRYYAEKYAHPSDEQIEAYYKQNSAKYIESNLERIVIPRKATAEDGPKAPDTSDTANAEKFRQQWIAGENPNKLQHAAYEAAGITGGTPEVTLGARLPGSLPIDQQAVFHLKAGEVSQVYSDPAAFYIYKVASVREIPLSEVKDSIVKALLQREVQDKVEEINKSAVPELNEQYFGPASPIGGPAMGDHPGPAGRPANAPPQ